MYVHLPLYAPDRFVDQSENGDYGACVGGIDWAAGVILNATAGTVVRFLPPLTVTTEEIDEGIAVLAKALQETLE